jgi:putative hydrolase of the HAD superfamily
MARAGEGQAREGAQPGAKVRAVVFDYGGVLTGPMRESFAIWMAKHRIAPESFSRVLKLWMSRSAPAGTPVHLLETGSITVAEFERTLAAELATVDGSPVVAEGLLSRAFGALSVEPTMIELVRAVGSVGLRTGLLSNSWGNIYPMELIDELFDGVVISGDVGLRKPDPAIYRMILERVDVSPAESVFVDDAEPNVVAAAELGMHAILHTDPSTTMARLAELVPELDLHVQSQRRNT